MAVLLAYLSGLQISNQLDRHLSPCFHNLHTTGYLMHVISTKPGDTSSGRTILNRGILEVGMWSLHALLAEDGM